MRKVPAQIHLYTFICTHTYIQQCTKLCNIEKFSSLYFVVPIFFDLEEKRKNFLEYPIECTIYFNQHVWYVIAIINYQNYIMDKLKILHKTVEIGKHMLFLKIEFSSYKLCFKDFLRNQGAFHREFHIHYNFSIDSFEYKSKAEALHFRQILDKNQKISRFHVEISYLRFS